jgi:hypothetical protein
VEDFRGKIVQLFSISPFSAAGLRKSHFFAVRWMHKIAVKCFTQAQNLKD